MKRFTETHDWVVQEENHSTTCCVGITAHAAKELGEVVHVELPMIGKKVKKGEEVAVLESTKAAGDIYAPITGEIVEINTRLTESTDLLNRDPEGGGWLYKVRSTKPDELKNLLNHEKYLTVIQ